MIAAALEIAKLADADPGTVLTVPIVPPAEWFTDLPPLDEWDPIGNETHPVTYVGPDGRYAALLAPYNECLIEGGRATGSCWTAPLSQTGYRYATAGKQWPVKLADGSIGSVDIGNICADLPHATGRETPQRRRAMFDDTSKLVARAAYVDRPDLGGIFALGAVVPGMTAARALKLGGTALSGEWFPVEGLPEPELVGPIVVGEPGFRRKIARRRQAAFAAVRLGTTGVYVGAWRAEVDPVCVVDGCEGDPTADVTEGDETFTVCATHAVKFNAAHGDGDWQGAAVALADVALFQPASLLDEAVEAAVDDLEDDDDDEGHTGTVVVALPSTGQWTDEIDEAHATITYVDGDDMTPEILDRLREWCAAEQESRRPFEASCAATGVIGGEGAAAVILNSGDLAELNTSATALLGELGIDPAYPSFIPHLTTGYDVDPIAHDPTRLIVFDRLALWHAGEDEGEFVLTAAVTAEAGCGCHTAPAVEVLEPVAASVPCGCQHPTVAAVPRETFQDAKGQFTAKAKAVQLTKGGKKKPKKKPAAGGGGGGGGKPAATADAPPAEPTAEEVAAGKKAAKEAAKAKAVVEKNGDIAGEIAKSISDLHESLDMLSGKAGSETDTIGTDAAYNSAKQVRWVKEAILQGDTAGALKALNESFATADTYASQLSSSTSTDGVKASNMATSARNAIGKLIERLGGDKPDPPSAVEAKRAKNEKAAADRAAKEAAKAAKEASIMPDVRIELEDTESVGHLAAAFDDPADEATPVEEPAVAAADDLPGANEDPRVGPLEERVAILEESLRELSARLAVESGLPPALPAAGEMGGE